MKTIDEYKKIPYFELWEVIRNDIKSSIVLRCKVLETDYLNRHPDRRELSPETKEWHKKLASCNIEGQLQALLVWAVSDLQTAEAELESITEN